MRAITLALAGMFLANTALAQESPPTCHGLDREQCRLAPGCEWVLALMLPPGWPGRVCIPMCRREDVLRVLGQGPGGLWRLRPVGPSDPFDF
jgi:hypothetical protein